MAFVVPGIAPIRNSQRALVSGNPYMNDSLVDSCSSRGANGLGWWGDGSIRWRQGELERRRSCFVVQEPQRLCAAVGEGAGHMRVVHRRQRVMYGFGLSR